MRRISLSRPETSTEPRPPEPRGGPRSRPVTRAVLAAGLVALAGCPQDGIRETLPPGARLDAFDQVAVNKVDVLWVVDSSGSMTQEQDNVARNFGKFFDFLAKAKTDYHIAVTTTDVVTVQGRLQGNPAVIDPSTPNPIEAFAANVRVGTAGSANEAGLDAARRTFELKPAGFLRDDAHLFLIFVSDEEDNSQPGTPKFFYRYFESLKGKGNESRVSAGAIIGDVPGGCASPADGYFANAGTRYKEVVDIVGGSVGSICDPQFDATLVQMGIDAVGLKRKFQLSKLPDPASIEVTVRYPCDATDGELAVCSFADRSECDRGGTVACKVKPLPERKSCDTTDEELSTGCRRSQKFCTRDDPFVWCWPASGGDGWEFEESTTTLVFQGEALPPKGAAIEVVYLEPERGVQP